MCFDPSFQYNVAGQGLRQWGGSSQRRAIRPAMRGELPEGD